MGNGDLSLPAIKPEQQRHQRASRQHQLHRRVGSEIPQLGDNERGTGTQRPRRRRPPRVAAAVWHELEMEGRHLELDHERKLDDKQGSSRGDDGKKRLGEPDDEGFVVHVHSPLIESIER